MSGPYNEEKKQYMRGYYKKHSERIKARVQKHYEATRDRQIAYRKQYYLDNHRAEVGIRGVYKSIRDQGFPKDKYQLLCCNCNWAKGIFGICPHESKRLQKKISIVEDDGLRAIAG